MSNRTKDVDTSHDHETQGHGRDATIGVGAGDAVIPPTVSPGDVAGKSVRLDFVLSDKSTGVFRDVPIAVPGYEILGELGRGGMGVVYKARQVRLDRVVALKMVLAGAHAGPEQFARFNSEAQAVAQFQHPNIVQIHEVGDHSGLPYFSLEFVDGGSLAQRTRGRPLAAIEAARTVAVLARAMHYAHGHGVVHRDLKPANVLITSDGVPKITDFGLAKRLEGESSSHTRSGAILGTPSYMAPEQASGSIHEIGPLTDVYALGAILYELITGRPPFMAANPMDTVMQVIRNEPIAPTQLQPKLPRDVETICLKCLNKEPQKRYPSALELADDLQRYITGEPIHARPVSMPERCWRWCWRNPLGAAVVAISTAAAVISVAAALVVNNSRNDAIRERTRADEKAAAETLAAERAKRSQAVAESQADLAIETVQTLVTKVQQQLGSGPAVRQLKKDLLDTALESAQKIVVSADNSGLLGRNAASAHMQIGYILRDQRNRQEALREYDECKQILDRLVADEPENVKNIANLAAVLAVLADINRPVDFEVGKQYAQRALDLRLQLLTLPESDEYPMSARQMFLADSYDWMLRLADTPSVSLYRGKALELLEPLAREPSARTPIKRALAWSYTVAAETDFRLGDLQEMRESYEKSAELFEELWREREGDVELKRLYAYAETNAGDAALFLDDPVGACERYQMALGLITDLSNADPTDVQQRGMLAQGHYRLATAYLRNKESQASNDEFRQCKEMREQLQRQDSSNRSRAMDLLLVLARCGERARVQKSIEVVHGFRNDGRWSIQIACCYALSSVATDPSGSPDELPPADRELRERCADQAVAAVQEAIDRGFGDLVQLEIDPDLDPIRGRPDFQALLDQLRNTGVPSTRRTDR